MESIHLTINQLYQKYKDNTIMKEKLREYICEKLPIKLEQFQNISNQRNNRKDYLSEKSDLFIHNFLNNEENKYFYIPVSNYFIVYENNHYSIINEDQILNIIGKEINCEKELQPWKHKIRTNIIKIIKENYVLNHIPESETIQNVLSLVRSSLCVNKENAKYILTIIGDNLLKKTNNIYFTNIRAKKWFDYISDLAFSYFKYSKNPTSNIKFKYYHHSMEDSRLIDLFNENYLCYDSDVYNPKLKEHILDILCVGAHYSMRYEDADNYLLQECSNQQLKDYAFYLKTHNKQQIVDIFKQEYLENTDDNQLFLNRENMIFIWKQFIKEKNLPLIIFSNELEEYLNINIDESTSLYNSITSRKLHVIKRFDSFWKQFMIEDEKEYDLEISELLTVYKKFCSDDKLNEEYIISIIEHFHKKEIVDNKYINGIVCKLWDKQKCINDALKEYNKNNTISIINLYKYYCSYANTNRHISIVSKHYFQKYIFDTVPECYIYNDNILEEYWDMI